jgi:mono/diheme cytochrome c family protein
VTKKKSKSTKSIPQKNAGKLILAIALLGGALVFGGKYLIENRTTERGEVVVPPLSPEANLGRVAFQSQCVACHGENAAGSERGPPLVNDIYRPAHHADLSFVRAVSLGVQQHHWLFGNMPPLPQVTRSEIDRMIVYIRELQRGNGIQ